MSANHTRTRRIGRTEVPLLGFGTAPLSSAPAWGGGAPIPEGQALETLQYAYEQGIRFFDTAPLYGMGLAETRTGKLLAQVPREGVIIATKVGYDIGGGVLRRDYSRDGVLRSLEGSLKRLNVDAVDILYVHDPDDYAEQVLEETFPALADLRAQGVIKAVGAGMNQWRVPLQFAQHADFDLFMIAGRYTLLEQGALPLLDTCHDKGIAIVAAGIYNSGILATGTNKTDAETPRYSYAPAPPEIVARVQALEAVCREWRVPLHTAATQFPLRHPAVQTVVVGFQQPAEVRACLDALSQTVPSGLWDQIHADPTRSKL
jgi:D-threo-aldose 1-dehydrogenase